MMQENQLVRHLKACEVMGGATTICSDKTGTLTQNRMSVVSAFLGETYYPQGSLPTVDKIHPILLEHLVRGASVNSTADLGTKINKIPITPPLWKRMLCAKKEFTEEVSSAVIGNPTEGAILKWLTNYNVDYKQVRKDIPVIHSISFSSKRKMMSSIVKVNDDYILYNKGAAEIIVKLCTKVLDQDGNIVAFSRQEEILDKVQEMAKLGQRTICLAYKFVDLKSWDETDEKDLIFNSLVGIEDPLRPEVKDAVRRCQKSGVQIRMVTGDNIETAKKIALECMWNLYCRYRCRVYGRSRIP
jgi:Ca2+ transporting ATPase